MLQEAQKVNLSPRVFSNWQTLRERAISSVNIHPTIPNYIVFPWINKVEDGRDKIDHNAEAQAAEIIKEAFPESNPDYILAIGNSGLSFGKAVQKKFVGASYLEVKKLEDNNIERNEDHKYVVAHSYSRNANLTFELPIIPKGKRVLIIDDVAAQAGVGLPIVEAVLRMGATIDGFGVYFDKAFQEGLQKISNTLGVMCFSVIRVAKILQEENRIELMDEERSLQLI